MGAFCLLTVGHACWVKLSYFLTPTYTIAPWGLIWDNWEKMRQIGIEILLTHHSFFLLKEGTLTYLGASGVAL